MIRSELIDSLLESHPHSCAQEFKAGKPLQALEPTASSDKCCNPIKFYPDE